MLHGRPDVCGWRETGGRRSFMIQIRSLPSLTVTILLGEELGRFMVSSGTLVSGLLLGCMNLRAWVMT